MTVSPPRRPRRTRKRSWAAVALWLGLPVAYPLSLGPAGYLVARGWLSATVVAEADPAYLPVASGLAAIPGTFGGKTALGWWREWNKRWYELGLWHAASAEPPSTGLPQKRETLPNRPR